MTQILKKISKLRARKAEGENIIKIRRVNDKIKQANTEFEELTSQKIQNTSIDIHIKTFMEIIIVIIYTKIVLEIPMELKTMICIFFSFDNVKS